MGQFLRIAIVLIGLWLILHFIKRALANRRSDWRVPIGIHITLSFLWGCVAGMGMVASRFAFLSGAG